MKDMMREEDEMSKNNGNATQENGEDTESDHTARPLTYLASVANSN